MKVRVPAKSSVNCFHEGQNASSLRVARSSTLFQQVTNKPILSCSLLHTWNISNALFSSPLLSKQVHKSSWILWTHNRGIHSTSILCKKQDKKRSGNKNKDEEEEDEEDEEIAQAEQAAADAEEDADIDRSLAQAKEEGNTEEIKKMEDLKTKLKQDRKEREKQKQGLINQPALLTRTEARQKMRKLELEKKKKQDEERMKRKEQKEQQKKPPPSKPDNNTNKPTTKASSKPKDDDDDYSWEKDFEPQSPKKKKK